MYGDHTGPNGQGLRNTIESPANLRADLEIASRPEVLDDIQESSELLFVLQHLRRIHRPRFSIIATHSGNAVSQTRRTVKPPPANFGRHQSPLSTIRCVLRPSVSQRLAGRVEIATNRILRGQAAIWLRTASRQSGSMCSSTSTHVTRSAATDGGTDADLMA